MAQALDNLSIELDRPDLTKTELDNLTERFNSVFLSAQAQAVPITYDHLEFSLATDAKFQHFQTQKKQTLKQIKKYKNKHSNKWNAVAVHTKRILNHCRKQTKRRKKKVIRSHNQRNAIEKMNDAIEYDDNNTQRIFWYHWNAMKHKKASFQAPLKLQNNHWIVDQPTQIQLFENEFHMKFKIVDSCNYQMVVNDCNLYLPTSSESTLSLSLPPSSSPTPPLSHFNLGPSSYSTLPTSPPSPMHPHSSSSRPPTSPISSRSTISSSSPTPINHNTPSHNNQGSPLRHSSGLGHATNKYWDTYNLPHARLLPGEFVPGCSCVPQEPPPLQPSTTPPWLQDRITEQEVYKVFKKVRRHKAVGPDKLYNYALVEAQSVLVPFLTKLYNLSWYMEYTPQIWRMSDYYALLKPGRDAHTVGNYRP